MNYKKKRMRAGIDFYTMSKKLGIPEDKYKEVESKKRLLEGHFVDKFLKIIQNAKQIKFERDMSMIGINQWFEDGSAEEALKTYGYNQKELATATGLSPSEVSKSFTGKKVADDTKEKIYDFLTNQINKKIDQDKKQVEVIDIKKKSKELGITQLDLAEKAGVSQVVISYLITGARPVSKENKAKIYKVIKELEEEKTVIKDLEEEKISDGVNDLEERLKKYSITKEELAAKAKVSSATVWRLTKGRNDAVSPKRTKAVYDALGELEKERGNITEEVKTPNVPMDDITEVLEDITLTDIQEEKELLIPTIDIDATLHGEPVEEELADEDVAEEEPVIEEVKFEEKEEIFYIEKEMLKEKIRKLERQIYLYEKLIERL